MDLRMTERANPSLLRPWRRYACVEDISPASLVGAGVRIVLLDRDNTLVPRDAISAPASVQLWLHSLHEAGLATVLVSNNFHVDAVARSARELGCTGIPRALKPLPRALWRALATGGFRPREAVMIGDQLFTDVIAGSLAGVRTILVAPQSTSDLWYTKIIRHVEGPLLARVPLGDAE